MLNQNFFASSIAALTLIGMIGTGAQAQNTPPPAPGTVPAIPTTPAPEPDVALKTLVGKPAPDFTLPDQTDKPRKLSADKGKWVVLAFYPADKTRGCTLQNQSYSANLGKFKPLNAVVYTLSTQNTASKREFCTSENLKHNLLSDVGGKVASAYNILRGTVARRVTFYIAPDGTIAEIDTKPRVGTAAEDSLATLKRLSTPKEIHAPAR